MKISRNVMLTFAYNDGGRYRINIEIQPRRLFAALLYMQTIASPEGTQGTQVERERGVTSVTCNTLQKLFCSLSFIFVNRLYYCLYWSAFAV